MTARWPASAGVVAVAGVTVAVIVAAVTAGFAGFALADGATRDLADDDTRGPAADTVVPDLAADSAANHPTPDGDADSETRVVENGSTVNANADSLPSGCEAVQGERRLTVDAGRQYAAEGDAYGYDLDSVTAPACTRLVVTLVNHDDVRHQWAVDGLPTDTYPGGYAAIEVAERGSVTAALVTPSQPGTYEGLSTLPQHEQNGMRLPLVVTGDETTRTTTTTTSDQSGGTVPGLGPLLALLALAGAALLAARR